ncbi:LicD family protein [Pediococcus pentosaceus]|nr:LicD family protein [Pediococcus pentosaceus]
MFGEITMQKRLNKIQYAEFQLAKKLKKVCEIEGLNCFMLGGAMLGAIRHEGFIPWDDDMDFGLKREEYERLYNVLSTGKYDLKVMSYKENNSHYYPLKIVDPEFQIISENSKDKEKNYVWIDIFPIDGTPNNYLSRKFHEFNLLKDRALLKLSQLNTIVAVNNPSRTTLEKIIITLGGIINTEKLLDEKKRMDVLDKHLNKYKTSDSKYLVNFMGAYKFKEMFTAQIYSNYIKYKFEDTEFLGIKDYDFYLKQLYGDYMTPPRKEDRDKHKVSLKK